MHIIKSRFDGRRSLF